MHENEFLPDIHAERGQAILFAIKILPPLEIGNALERSVETVGPAVVRALQTRSGATRLGHDCCGMMAADVEKSPQLAVLPANHEHRFTGDLRSDVLTGPRYLLRAAHHLPGAAECGLAFQIGDSLVRVPRAGDGRGLAEGLAGIEGGDDFLQ